MHCGADNEEEDEDGGNGYIDLDGRSTADLGDAGSVRRPGGLILLSQHGFEGVDG